MESIQEQYKEGVETLRWELKYNRTSVHLIMDPKEQEELRKNPELLKNYFNQITVYHKTQGFNPIEGENVKVPMQIIQGKPNLDIIAMFIDFTIDRFYNFNGYNSPQGTREHGTNKTASEVSINMQNDMLTTQLKVQLRTRYINRLIKIIGKVMGHKDIDCYIEIHGMSTTEQDKLFDQTIIAYQTGIISRAEAIAKVYKISIEEAEEKAKKIEKEEKAKQEQEAEQKVSPNKALQGSKK